MTLLMERGGFDWLESTLPLRKLFNKCLRVTQNLIILTRCTSVLSEAIQQMQPNVIGQRITSGKNIKTPTSADSL